MRLLSLFSGIGAFEKALTLNGMSYELVNYCEIDKYASKAYSVIHNVSEDLNLRDVRAVDTTALKDIDLLTYGFPCQDISCAGEQKGFVDTDGNVTRSGLFFEALRIILGVKPKVAIAENVKALTTKKFTKEFDIVLKGLDTAGYNNYWSVLNAKDYGTPQNRERVFIISIRKDIDNGSFSFPTPVPLEIRLKDVLEKDVDEKFYLSSVQIQRIKTISYLSGQRRIQEKDWYDTLCARDWKDPKCVMVQTNNCIELGWIPKSDTGIKHQSNTFYSSEGVARTLTACDYKSPMMVTETAKVMQVGNLRQGNGWDNPQCGRVYDTNGLSPTLNTMQGGDRQPKIVERVTAAAMRGRGSDNTQQIELSDRDYSNALTLVQKDSLVAEHAPFRIRKLTPLECWRLMGFTDDDCNKVKAAGISNTQLYKMAGNSICVSVLQAIFTNLRGVLC